MGYTDPPDFVALEVVTAAELNILSDDIADLNTRTTPGHDLVATSQSTTSATFTNLSTSGPAVTITVGSNGLALVTLACSVTSTSNIGGLMGFAVSGATTVAASAANSIGMKVDSSTAAFRLSGAFIVSSLTAGSNTFTAKYLSLNGGSSVTFQDRAITATPLAS